MDWFSIAYKTPTQVKSGINDNIEAIVTTYTIVHCKSL